MKILKERSPPEQFYIAECLKCDAIVQYTEKEFSNIHRLKGNTRTIYIYCEVCFTDMAMQIYNSTSKEAQEILKKI